MTHCGGGGDHRAIADKFNACVADNNGDEAPCQPMLRSFLACAKQAVAEVEARRSQSAVEKPAAK